MSTEGESSFRRKQAVAAVAQQPRVEGALKLYHMECDCSLPVPLLASEVKNLTAFGCDTISTAC